MDCSIVEKSLNQFFSEMSKDQKNIVEHNTKIIVS